MVKKSLIPVQIVEIFEKIGKIKHLEYDANNKCIDFQAGDIVKCSILEGVFEVYGTDQGRDKVFITLLSNDEDIFPVCPKYLKKLNINKNTVRILYK